MNLQIMNKDVVNFVIIYKEKIYSKIIKTMDKQLNTIQTQLKTIKTISKHYNPIKTM